MEKRVKTHILMKILTKRDTEGLHKALVAESGYTKTV
jgi:hypothetical protein